MDNLIDYEKIIRSKIKRIDTLRLKKTDIEKQLQYALNHNADTKIFKKRLRDINESIRLHKRRLDELYKDCMKKFDLVKIDKIIPHKYFNDTPNKYISDAPFGEFVRDQCFWEDLSKNIDDKKAGNLRLCEDKRQEYIKGQFLEDKKMKKDTLYKIKTVDGKEVYGHFLTTDSQGMSVFEIKGQGGVIAAAADNFEKVLPYTIDVEYGESVDNVNVRIYSYFAKAGQFEVGDVLIAGDSYSIMRVCAIDTKAEKANRHIKGYKIGTATLIKQPDDDEVSND